MMTQPLFITFLILVCTLAFIIQGKYRADFIALVGLAILGIIGILTPEDLLAGFANPVVIMVAALSVVSAGIFNSGLVDGIGDYLLRLGDGPSETKLLLIVMLTGGFLSAFLSGTGIVVILLPIVMSMAIKKKMSPSRYLVPFAYASSLGAVLTLIGTASNIYISDLLKKREIITLTFFDFSPIGLVAFWAGIFFILTIGRRFLPRESVVAKKSAKGISAGELAGMYKIYDRLHYLHIPAGSDIVGERLLDLQLPVHYEITLIEIRRKKEKQLSLLSKQVSISAKADEVLHPDDIILVFGEDENVERFTKDYELEYRHFNPEQIRKFFVSSQFGLTEMLIMPNSIYENQTLSNVHFREKYRCNVLAINRNGEYIQTDIGTEKLKPGDALLIHGEWENIERISSDLEDVMVIGSSSDETEIIQTQPELKPKALKAALITSLMIVLLSIDTIPDVLSVLIAALLMVITGCVRSMEEAYQKINWEPVLLFAAMLGIMSALEKAGGVRLLSDSFALFFKNTGPYGLLSGFYLLTMLLSPFIPYGVAAVVMAPIALLSSTILGVSPIPILMGITISASLALVSPKAKSSNTLVMTASEYSTRDFILLGILLQVFVGIVMIFAIPLFFSF